MRIENIQLLDLGAESAYGVSYHPHRNILSGGGKSIRLWDIQSLELIRQIDGNSHTIFSTAFNSQGDRLVTASADGVIKYWDADSWHNIIEIKAHPRHLQFLKHCPSKAIVASASFSDNTSKLWNMDKPSLIASLPLGGLAFSPDGEKLAVAGDNAISVYSATSGDLLNVINTGNSDYWGHMAYSPDGKYLVYVTQQEQIALWDFTAKSICATFGTNYAGNNLPIFSPDSQLLAFAQSDPPVFELWHIDKRQKIGDFSAPVDRFTSLLFSPDGRTFIATSGPSYGAIFGTWHIDYAD